MQAIWNSLGIVVIVSGITTVVVYDQHSMISSMEPPRHIDETRTAVDFRPPAANAEATTPQIVFAEAPSWSSFDEMHGVYTQAFVDSEGFGLSRILTFHEPTDRSLFVNGVPHRMAGMQLIGLMRNEPVAYKSSWINVTRNSIANAEQRPLTSFERLALTRLEEGENHVWHPARMQDEIPADAATAAQRTIPQEAIELIRTSADNNWKNHGQLMGALRASRSCLKCHDVAEGTLPGAFVYDLKPVANPTPQESPSVSVLQSHPSGDAANR